MKRFISVVLCVMLVFSITFFSVKKVALSSEKDSEIGVVTTEVFAKISTGGVIGYKYNGINTFLGIPYATAKRFEMPKRVSSWQGYRTCFVYGEVCPQGLKTMNKFDIMCYSNAAIENEESCLTVNVWTPSMDPKAKKPVIVWLHGGGFTTGSAHEYKFYEGTNLAKFGDIVFVSVNHRLNVLGFLDLSAYGEKYKYSGNAGMADIISALQWVRENISVFGGDPNNVTIVGQSGGGSKVTTLMGMPAAKGLFHKAVVMSGGSAKATRTKAQAQAETKKLLEILKISEKEVDKLQTIPYDELYAAAQKAGIMFGPVVDGDYYPDGTFKMSKNIPLMCGNVMGEFNTNLTGLLLGDFPTPEAWQKSNISKISDEEAKKLYKEKYGDKAEAIIQAFKKAYPGHKLVEGLFLNDRYGFFSTLSIADAMVSYGGKVYNYVVAYNYPLFGGIVAVHTMNDVPFFFYNLDKVPAWIAGDEKTAYKVAKEMATALVNFARYGNPSQSGLPWPNYTIKNHATMIFDKTSGVKYDFDRELFNLIHAAMQNK
ncbi:Carboxylesterase type B [Caldicellulosiruptor hydrothermalis 108]|uniref:Carboxylic ester hydrolase n=1 Tax=Caldicellulosiruptor hydrothermalis (strain DSM 18901 / VKM B-2411 / 108) TaxID=632292 RepID=E4Q8R3_CALH1|nr:carboxylesterase family protein [Caldicellulosiruptor hydrothermalis]ADQ08037.1 Carboxylesterase type B [Caldicellulosiruptor hydrothermalis 108]